MIKLIQKEQERVEELSEQQMDMIFDCISHRICGLREAMEHFPHENDFIQGKIDELDKIASIIGPMTV